jgi:hypothetical protein
VGISPAHLPDNLARFLGRHMRYRTTVKNVQIGQLTRPHNAMAGAGKAPGQFFYFANI